MTTGNNNGCIVSLVKTKAANSCFLHWRNLLVNRACSWPMFWENCWTNMNQPGNHRMPPGSFPLPKAGALGWPRGFLNWWCGLDWFCCCFLLVNPHDQRSDWEAMIGLLRTWPSDFTGCYMHEFTPWSGLIFEFKKNWKISTIDGFKYKQTMAHY